MARQNIPTTGYWITMATTIDTNFIELYSNGTTYSADILANTSAIGVHIADVANPHGVTASQLSLGNVNNTADIDKPVSTDQQTALDLKEDDLGTPTNNGDVLSSTTGDVRTWVTPSSNWILTTNNITPLAIVYPTNILEDSTSINLIPNVLAGTSGSGTLQTYSLVAGALPTGATLSPGSGTISCVLGAGAQGPSSATIRVITPVSTTDYVWNWEVKTTFTGITHFSNSEDLYTGLTLSSINSKYAEEVFIKAPVTGTINASGVFAIAGTEAVYMLPSTSNTWDYIIARSDIQYWNLIRGSTQNPNTLADTNVVVGTESHLVANTTDNVSVGGVSYPSDITMHYLTEQNYIRMTKEAGLDNVLTSTGTWSMGGVFADAVPRDGLVRTLVSRDGRNYFGFKYSATNANCSFYYGNGNVSGTLPFASVPVSIAAGQAWCLRSNGTTLVFEIGSTTCISSTTPFSAIDGASANALDILLFKGVASNKLVSPINKTHLHMAYNQGEMSHLWIHNGANDVGAATDQTVLATDIPAGSQYYWLLTETTGKTFAATTGGITLNGLTDL